MSQGSLEKLFFEERLDWRLRSVLEVGRDVPGGWCLYQSSDVTILVLGSQVTEKSEVLDLAATAYLRSLSLPRVAKCFDVALTLWEEKQASGKVWSIDTDGRFCGYFSHCLNYRILESGGVLGFDVLAGDYVDRGKGNFDVLAIVAEDMTGLKEILGLIYGGDWAHV